MKSKSEDKSVTEEELLDRGGEISPDDVLKLHAVTNSERNG